MRELEANHKLFEKDPKGAAKLFQWRVARRMICDAPYPAPLSNIKGLAGGREGSYVDEKLIISYPFLSDILGQMTLDEHQPKVVRLNVSGRGRNAGAHGGSVAALRLKVITADLAAPEGGWTATNSQEAALDWFIQDLKEKALKVPIRSDDEERIVRNWTVSASEGPRAVWLRAQF
jgi:hypothetical protein